MAEKGKNLFFLEKYDHLERFISYYYQVSLVRELKPESVLEVGIGSMVVSEYLKRAGIEITTCDIDSKLKPDKVGDIRNLPFKDEAFDMVLAFQILEHLPFSDFEKALKEIRRVSRKFIVISLPYRHTCFEAVVKVPFVRTIFKKPFLDFCLRIPLVFYNEKRLGKHQWEMGLRRYSLKKIKKHLSKYFKIIKEVRPVLDSYHHFFVLEKVK